MIALFISNNDFVKATAIYVDKKRYEGPYFKNDSNPNRFRNLMMRKLLEFHFENNEP